MITIITATYNSEKTISDTLVSILNQTLDRFEYIIIDGDSTDNTVNIIKEFEPSFKKRNINFKWISEKDSGIYNAWNKGINLSTGNWIGFLGSDDKYYKNALANYKNAIANYKNLDYISSKVKLINNGKVVKTISGAWKWKTFKRYMNVAHAGSLHSRAYFNKYGLFNENFIIAGDYEILLRAKEKLNYFFLNKITVEMDANGISNNQVYLTLLETKKAKIKTIGANKYSSMIYFYWAIFKAKIKELYRWI